MTKYTVTWVGSRTERALRLEGIEAENCRDAFDKMVAEHKRPSYPNIQVYKGLGFFEHEEFDNPHYVKPAKTHPKTVGESHSQQPTPIGNSTRQPITPAGSPQSSSWATLYRVCGGIAFVFGFIGTIAVAQKNEEAGFQLAVMAIALTLTCFLAAFLIDVLTDMRHYLKAIAEKE